MGALGCKTLFFASVLALLYIAPAWSLKWAMLDSYYVALDYNASLVLEGNPYTPPKEQYIQIDNFVVNSAEITIEINFFWRGYQLGTGDPNQPLFYWGGTTGPYIFITPRTNPTSNVTEVPPQMGVYLYDGTNPVELYTFSGYVDNRWCHISVGLSQTAGQSYGAVSNWGTSGWEDGTVTYFTSSLRPSNVGTKPLYFGNVPGALRSSLGVTQPYAGKIDEYRVWNKFMTYTEVQNIRQVSLVGNEPNLLAYYRFDEPSGNNILDSCTNPPIFNGVFAGADAKDIQRLLHTQPASSSFATDPDKYTPIIRANREMPWNGQLTFQIAVDVDPSIVWTSRIRTFPPHTQLCMGPSCTGQGSNQMVGPSYRAFETTATATRGSCGLTENGVLYATQQSSTSTDFTLSIKVPQLNVDLSAAQRQVIPTTGDVTLSFAGSNLGLAGNLANNENVVIKLTSGANWPCSSPRIERSPSEVLKCNVGPGVGTGSLVGTLCNKAFTLPNIFAYEAPTVQQINGLNISDLMIVGTNMGPDRIFDQSYDNISLVDDLGEIACVVEQIVNHTTVFCSTSPVELEAKTYTLRLTIGGQTVETPFDFQICNPPCEHGGKCVGTNKCNCELTGYEGDWCQTELKCFPLCKKENGVCVRSTEDGKLRCSCFKDWTGVDCSKSPGDDGKSNTPLIAGIVGGGGGVIVLLSIVIVILAIRKARQPKRGGVNFIPLEKKDFTKIIWGEQLNQNPEKTTGNTKQLEELLVEDNLELAATISRITQITEADKIAKAMVVIFQENDKVLHLLQAFIGEEVNTTESAGTLFRSNSMVSKMFKFYSRLIGLPYLYETIGPEINEIIEGELGLEVDPEKMEEGTDLDEMRWTLMAQSQKILKSILNSVEKCPPQFRVLFAHIKKCVAERFPGNVNTTIGGFIFLRFFCPAVSSPEAYGIVEEPPSASSRRLLILITKVLQNLSNDVEFGSKEPYMTKMNDFIHSNRSKLEQYYEKLVKPSSKPPVVTETPKHMKALSLAVLSNHIRDNINKVEDPALKAKLEAIV